MTLAVLLLTLSGSAALAQDNAAVPPPEPCRANPMFRAFDFWVGDWDVSNRANGKHAGVNRIEKIERGCALTEHWTGDSGSTGMSLNYYNPLTGKWRQHWIAAGNYSIDIEGGLERGSMALAGKIYYYTTGNVADFRGVWTPNPDGSVRQHFQQYNPDSKAWDEWFDGLYVKKKRDERAPVDGGRNGAK